MEFLHSEPIGQAYREIAVFFYKTVGFLVHNVVCKSNKSKGLVADRVKFIFCCRYFQVCKLCVASGLKMEPTCPLQILLRDALGLCVLPLGCHISHASFVRILLLWLVKELCVVA